MARAERAGPGADAAVTPDGNAGNAFAAGQCRRAERASVTAGRCGACCTESACCAGGRIGDAESIGSPGPSRISSAGSMRHGKIQLLWWV